MFQNITKRNNRTLYAEKTKPQKFEKSGELSKLERFENEVLPHYQYLKNTAKYLVRNRNEAEDILQETLTQAFKSLDNYQDGTNCRAWLTKILTNIHLRWIRKNQRFTQISEENSLHHKFVDSSMDLHAKFISKDLATSLTALSLQFRQIVWLADVEEFTYQEIADQLNIPIGTVMSRLWRGRQKLRDEFNKRTLKINS